ncbi:MAG: DUF3343 domain-containing protein [Spirochaetota bacterium]
MFKNTRTVIRAEKIIAEKGIPLEVFPTPRSISSECGMSIRVLDAHMKTVDELLGKSHIEFRKHVFSNGESG